MGSTFMRSLLRAARHHPPARRVWEAGKTRICSRLGSASALMQSPGPQTSAENACEGAMIERENLFPDALSKRIVGGHVLYAPVVTVVPGKLVFVSGLLARNRAGEIVGKGDMGAQIRQVGENLKAALAAAGATLADLVRTQTFTTDIDEFF